MRRPPFSRSRSRSSSRPRSRFLTRALYLLPALALLAACSSGGSPTPPPDDNATGPITVASGLDVTGTDGVRMQLIKEWNRRHKDDPALQATLVELPGDADQQRSQLLGALQSGSARYDVVNLDVTWVPEFAEARLISPLDAPDTDVIAPVAATAGWKGTTYAMPFNSDVGLLYYRVDYLDQAQIDPADRPNSGWSWTRFTSTINDLLRRRQGTYAGWTTPLKPSESLTVNTIEAFASSGVQLTDVDGHYIADPDKLKTGLWAIQDRASSDRTLPAAHSSNESASISDFAAGHAAFLRQWPYAYGILQRSLPKGALGVARLPGSAVLGGQNLAVSAASPRAERARKLIEFLTRQESERCLLDAGFAATRASAYTGTGPACWPGVEEAINRVHSGGESSAPSSSSSPSASSSASSASSPADAVPSAILSDALRSAVQRPRTPYYGAFTQVLQTAIHTWLTAPHPDVGQTAADLDRDLRAALDGR